MLRPLDYAWTPLRSYPCWTVTIKMGQLHCMASNHQKFLNLFINDGYLMPMLKCNIANQVEWIPRCRASCKKKHYLIQCQCLESIVNDFCNRQGVVSGWAAAILRSTEAYPSLDDSNILYSIKTTCCVLRIIVYHKSLIWVYKSSTAYINMLVLLLYSLSNWYMVQMIRKIQLASILWKLFF